MNEVIILGKDVIWTKGIHQPGSGLSLNERSDIVSMVEFKTQIQDFAEKHLPNDYKSMAAPKLQFPIKRNNFSTDPGFYTITAYPDHDPLYPNHILDYNCGDLSYDLENGYNHTGTDFFPWPFPWKKMYNDEIRVEAAAAGILYIKQDGNYDQHCELNADNWNGCAILHEDGSTAWYIHMKKNSLTQKFVGEKIEAGEYLGIVGSSGSSIAPHLHLEFYNAEGVLTDPFEGLCNPDITASWWQDQVNYKERGINKISTNNHVPVLDQCPEPEITYESEQFKPGDTIFLVTYMKNIFTGDQISLTLRKPDGAVFSSWHWSSEDPFYAASWLYFYTILHNTNYGKWTFEAEYDGKNYSHEFDYKETLGIERNQFAKTLIKPNPAHDILMIEASFLPDEIQIMDFYGLVKISYKPKKDDGLKIKLNISQLEKGFYFISVKNGNNRETYKLIVD